MLSNIKNFYNTRLGRNLFKSTTLGLSLALGLLPITLIGRLLIVIRDTPNVESQLASNALYAELLYWMQDLLGRAMAGLFVILFCAALLALILINRHKDMTKEGLNMSTFIPRIFIRVAITPVLSLFALVAGFEFLQENIALKLFIAQFILATLAFLLVHSSEYDIQPADDA